jgi:peptide chain release factor 2
MKPPARQPKRHRDWMNSGGIFDVAASQQLKADIESAMASPTFWDDKDKAQKMVAQLSACKSLLDPFHEVESKVDDFAALAELIAEDPEEGLLREASDSWPRLEPALANLELMSFLSGRFDKNNAIISVHAGSGGTESCDWASMLYRMYMRWIERKGFNSEVIDYQEDGVAGIKSATIMVTGLHAYGYLQAERGVHRLVRISPFDSNKRRHTSFAALEVSPEIDDEIEVEIEEKDLRVDTFRASGAGGQHVNTTDSAVRITHVPTGVVVSCQNERSQHQNRHTAMKILKSKLYERQLAELTDMKNAAAGPKEENAWCSQIRSYVLHPYQMVKDLRTEAETSNTGSVLDGDLDMFIEAWLRSGKSEPIAAGED